MKLKRLFIIKKKDENWVLAVRKYPLFILQNYLGGYNLVVECRASEPIAWVRFPLPTPYLFL